MRFTLKNVGFPYMKIMKGRSQVGRTYKAADGTYTCQMHGKPVHEGASSHEEAFREGIARYLGHSSASSLHAANRVVRSRNAARRADAGRLAHDMLSDHPATRAAAWNRLMKGL